MSLFHSIGNNSIPKDVTQRLKIGRLFDGRGRIPMLLEKMHEIVSSVIRTGRRTIMSAVIVEHEWRAKELSRKTGGEINRLNRRRVEKKTFVLRYMNVSILDEGRPGFPGTSLAGIIARKSHLTGEWAKADAGQASFASRLILLQDLLDHFNSSGPFAGYRLEPSKTAAP